MDEAIRLPQIMVVDDDHDTVAILARHLQREGFVAIEANSGAQCLKLVHENEVDVILLDLMMPEMDGFQVVRALKNSPVTADIPIIMITARDDLDARAEGMRLGLHRAPLLAGSRRCGQDRSADRDCRQHHRVHHRRRSALERVTGP